MKMEQIRDDLKEIRYYYSMKDLFNKGESKVKPTAVLEKVEKYNKLMETAPAKMYILYVALYLENNTQASLAEEWNYTPDYIKELNLKLCEFILKKLRDEL